MSEVTKKKEPKVSFDECAKRLRSRARGKGMFYGEDEGVPIESDGKCGLRLFLRRLEIYEGLRDRA